MSIKLPWTIVPRTPIDLLRLEEAIRTVLRCDGSACAVLQSTEYARLKIEVRHLMSGWGGALPLLSDAICGARPLCALSNAVALYASRSIDGEITLALKGRELTMEMDPSAETEQAEEPPPKRARAGRPPFSERFQGLKSFEAALLASRGQSYAPRGRPSAIAPKRAQMIHKRTSLST